MKKILPIKVDSFLKTTLTTALMAVSVHAVKAQGLTFETLYKGDPLNGTQISNGDKVLNIEGGTGPLFVKANQGITFLAADKSGNLAMGYNSGNRIIRVNQGNSTMTVFQTVGVTLNALKIDEQDEYIYYGGTGTLYRAIWKNTGANTSVGFYSSSSAGTSTGTTVKAIPFLLTGDDVYYNGSSTLSNFTFGSVRAIAFDAAGNLFFADATNQLISKISIVKQNVSGDMASGVSTLTLSDVTGLKVGSIVSGINIPASTYIGSIDAITKTISLTTDNLTTPKVTIGIVDNKATLAFVTGVDPIMGTGVAGAATLPAPAGTSALNFNAGSSGYSVGMIFDPSGNLYVTDQANSRIVKIAAVSGSVSATSAASVFATGVGSTPAGLAFDVSGRLYITRRSDHTIARTVSAAGGAVETVAGSSGKIVMTNYTTNGNAVSATITPTEMAKLSVGMTLRGTNFALGTKIVSIESANSFTISPTSTASSTVTGAFTATSADGFTTAGIGTTNSGQLDGPSGIVIFGDNIYVTESTGNYVRVLYGPNVLPVVINTPFNAKSNSSGSVALAWTTSSEVNNNSFIISRSNDGVHFQELQRLVSKSASGAAYSFTDFSPSGGINYYKLSQVDNDGTIKVLGVQPINLSLDKSPLAIYPNPITNGVFTIKSPSTGSSSMSIKIFDVNGKEVPTTSLNKTDDGIYTFRLNDKTAPGTYVIRVSSGEVGKLIVK